MAEESIESLVTPEKNEFSFAIMKMGINSAEKPPSPISGELSPVPNCRASIVSCVTGDNPESCSNEKQDRVVDTTKRRVPIYLRASTGSCHDICKYGGHHASKENTREYLQKSFLGKSSPNEVISVKKDEKIEGKATEPSRTRTSKFSPNHKSVEHGPSSEMKRRLSLVKVSPLSKSCSPRLSNVSGNKSRLPNLSPCNKSLVSETPEIIKREIPLLPENLKDRAKKGGSGESKESVRHSSANPNLIKVKPISALGNSHGIQTGPKQKSPMASADKAMETPAVHLSASRLSLGKAASVKAREVGRLRSSLPSSSSSTLKYRKGTAESNSFVSVKNLHVVETVAGNNALGPKASKVGSEKSSSFPLNNQKGIEKSEGEEPEKTLHVISYEAENKASQSSSSPKSYSSRLRAQSLSSWEDKEENDELRNSGYDGDEFNSENIVPVETGDIKPVEKDLTRPMSHFSLSHEDDDDDEKINYNKSEADSESEYLQPLKENHDSTSLSSNEEDDGDDEDDNMFQSSLKTSSLLSIDKKGEEVNGELDEFVFSEKMARVETGKVQSMKESHKTLKKSKLVPSVDKNQSPVKLKFRRGKIIDPKLENNIPKRLRFKRAGTVNKTGYCIPDSNKPIEIGNVQPNKTLRKAESSISYSKRSVDIKQGTPNKSLRKNRSTLCEDKSRSPVSLIRREKMVESQMGNKSPTRLKFYRSRVAGPEDGKSDLRRNIIKKAVGKNDTIGFELSSRKVILKHPEVQKKKDGQVLLNNVIEETASKLVESRKSKVKALVGAFETVISLQESKPSH